MKFNTCPDCVAQPFCPIFSGQTKVDWNWCKAALRLETALKISDIPKIYQRANAHNWKITSDNRDAIERLLPYLNNIVDVVDTGQNFIFTGSDVGAGKTYLACTLLNHYIYKTCLTSQFDFENPLSLFVDYTHLINLLRYKRDELSTWDLVNKILKAPLVLLDDIGAGTISPFALEQTYHIINHRVNCGLSTIITSNFSVVDLDTKILGSRIVSRLTKNHVHFSISGRDWRLGV